MKKYEKPTIIINSELSEGIYMASGSSVPSCDSKYINGMYHSPDYSSSDNYITRFGCNGCPAFRHNGCGLQTDYIDSNCSSTYDVDKGNRKPNWEKNGLNPYDKIDWSKVNLC